MPEVQTQGVTGQGHLPLVLLAAHGVWCVATFLCVPQLVAESLQSPPRLHMAFPCVRGSVGTPSAPLARLRVLAFTADAENPG